MPTLFPRLASGNGRVEPQLALQAACAYRVFSAQRRNLDILRLLTKTFLLQISITRLEKAHPLEKLEIMELERIYFDNPVNLME